jgi:transposase InsO family protein
VVFNEHVHIDHVGPFEDKEGQKVWILSMTDAATRWPELMAVTDVGALTTAKALHDMWIARWGPPDHLTSDQGTAFCNKVFEEFNKHYATNHIRTTPGHPQSNGLEERAHRALKDIIATTIREQGLRPTEWLDALHSAARVMRATVHSSTGMSPHEALTGLKMPMRDVRLAGPRAQELVADGTGWTTAPRRTATRRGTAYTIGWRAWSMTWSSGSHTCWTKS